MLVTVTEDRMGNILLDPVSDRTRQRLIRELAVPSRHQRDALVFLQEGMGAEEFIKDLPPRARRTLQGGWSATVRMDEEAFLSMRKEY
jgi:hypothetical protein